MIVRSGAGCSDIHILQFLCTVTAKSIDVTVTILLLPYSSAVNYCIFAVQCFVFSIVLDIKHQLQNNPNIYFIANKEV